MLQGLENPRIQTRSRLLCTKKPRDQVFILHEMGPCGVEMVLMVEYGPEALGDGRLENRFMVSGSRFTVVIEGCRMQGLGFRR